jgi:hypothetical protein
MQAKAFAGAINRRWSDAESSSDLGFAEALFKPTLHELFLGPVQFAFPSGGSLVVQSGESILFVASFPASLRSHGVSKSQGQIFLSGQFTLSEHDGDEASLGLIVQGVAIDGFMAAENNAVAVALNEPQAWTDEDALVGGGILRWRKERISGRCVHTELDAPEG